MKTGLIAKMIVAAGALVLSSQAMANYACAVVAPSAAGASDFNQVLVKKDFADADLSKGAEVYQETGLVYVANVGTEGALTVIIVDSASQQPVDAAIGNGSEVALINMNLHRGLVCVRH